MYAHVMEAPPPPSQHNSELAGVAGLDALVLQMLAKDREQRPADAQALLQEISLVEAQMSWGMPTVTPSGRPATPAKPSLPLSPTTPSTPPPPRRVTAQSSPSPKDLRAPAFSAVPVSVERKQLYTRALMGVGAVLVMVFLAIMGWQRLMPGEQDDGRPSPTAEPQEPLTEPAAMSPSSEPPSSQPQAQPSQLRERSDAARAEERRRVQIGSHLDRAQQAMTRGEYRTAISEFEAALRLDANHARTPAGLARARKARAVECAIIQCED